ncbi:DUF4252 domain-containing protein [uncultured Polaribacter sp.]|uniref:DUF4252 domain-containing protein n=1 Tax=uncultured Polaribacter sp. TaxID=174711 RepID=UPI0034577013
MKRTYKYLILFCFLILYSCGSQQTFRTFYDAHKREMGVTSFQIPKFMRGLLGTISPQVGSFFKNVQDLKFITFKDITSAKQLLLVEEINAITDENFTDMLRSNSLERTKIVSVKENGEVVTEAIIFNSTLAKTSAFYLKGQFDPEKLKHLAEANEFDNLSNSLLLKQQNFLSPSFNPN